MHSMELKLVILASPFTLKKYSRNSVINYGRRQRKISENEGLTADS